MSSLAYAENKNFSSKKTPNSGQLEISCNIANVSLFLCPINAHKEKKVEHFFGLYSSLKSTCKEKIFLGKTPISNVFLPRGKYILLVPKTYLFTRKSFIKINIEPETTTYYSLKLFNIVEHDGPSM